jgi:hypothetical protein
MTRVRARGNFYSRDIGRTWKVAEGLDYTASAMMTLPGSAS